MYTHNKQPPLPAAALAGGHFPVLLQAPQPQLGGTIHPNNTAIIKAIVAGDLRGMEMALWYVPPTYQQQQHPTSATTTPQHAAPPPTSSTHETNSIGDNSKRESRSGKKGDDDDGSEEAASASKARAQYIHHFNQFHSPSGTDGSGTFPDSTSGVCGDEDDANSAMNRLSGLVTMTIGARLRHTQALALACNLQTSSLPPSSTSKKDEDDYDAVSEEDEAPLSILHIAASNSSIAVVEWCCQYTPSLLHKTGGPCKWSPLHYAAFNQSPTCCALLRHSGADINARDINDDTPVDVALYTAVGAGEVLSSQVQRVLRQQQMRNPGDDDGFEDELNNPNDNNTNNHDSGASSVFRGVATRGGGDNQGGRRRRNLLLGEATATLGASDDSDAEDGGSSSSPRGHAANNNRNGNERRHHYHGGGTSSSLLDANDRAIVSQVKRTNMASDVANLPPHLLAGVSVGTMRSVEAVMAVLDSRTANDTTTANNAPAATSRDTRILPTLLPSGRVEWSCVNHKQNEYDKTLAVAKAFEEELRVRQEADAAKQAKEAAERRAAHLKEETIRQSRAKFLAGNISLQRNCLLTQEKVHREEFVDYVSIWTQRCQLIFGEKASEIAVIVAERDAELAELQRLEDERNKKKKKKKRKGKKGTFPNKRRSSSTSGVAGGGAIPSTNANNNTNNDNSMSSSRAGSANASRTGTPPLSLPGSRRGTTVSFPTTTGGGGSPSPPPPALPLRSMRGSIAGQLPPIGGGGGISSHTPRASSSATSSSLAHNQQGWTPQVSTGFILNHAHESQFVLNAFAPAAKHPPLGLVENPWLFNTTGCAFGGGMTSNAGFGESGAMGGVGSKRDSTFGGDHTRMGRSQANRGSSSAMEGSKRSLVGPPSSSASGFGLAPTVSMAAHSAATSFNPIAHSAAEVALLLTSERVLSQQHHNHSSGGGGGGGGVSDLDLIYGLRPSAAPLASRVTAVDVRHLLMLPRNGGTTTTGTSAEESQSAVNFSPLEALVVPKPLHTSIETAAIRSLMSAHYHLVHQNVLSPEEAESRFPIPYQLLPGSKTILSKADKIKLQRQKNASMAQRRLNDSRGNVARVILQEVFRQELTLLELTEFYARRRIFGVWLGSLAGIVNQNCPTLSRVHTGNFAYSTELNAFKWMCCGQKDDPSAPGCVAAKNPSSAPFHSGRYLFHRVDGRCCYSRTIRVTGHDRRRLKRVMQKRAQRRIQDAKAAQDERRQAAEREKEEEKESRRHMVLGYRRGGGAPPTTTTTPPLRASPATLRRGMSNSSTDSCTSSSARSSSSGSNNRLHNNNSGDDDSDTIELASADSASTSASMALLHGGGAGRSSPHNLTMMRPLSPLSAINVEVSSSASSTTSFFDSDSSGGGGGDGGSGRVSRVHTTTSGFASRVAANRLQQISRGRAGGEQPNNKTQGVHNNKTVLKRRTAWVYAGLSHAEVKRRVAKQRSSTGHHTATTEPPQPSLKSQNP